MKTTIQLLTTTLLLGAITATATDSVTTPPKMATSTTKAPAAIHELLGDTLTNQQGDKISTDALQGKIIGIYFSAHWCPPCRGFTPSLVKFYNELIKQGKSFEIVFVSSDRSEDDMKKYMDDMNMPWLALPFGDKHKQSLSEKFEIRSIPSLILIDAAGNVITKNGRGDVSKKGTEAFDSWKN